MGRFSLYKSILSWIQSTTIKPSEDVEGYVQHVIDYILRDTLVGLIKLSKHRQESTKSASIAIGTNATVQLGYDIHKYDAVFGPLPTHSIRVVKTNGHKRKRQRNEDAGASNQLLRILKKRITEEKKSNKHNNDIKLIRHINRRKHETVSETTIAFIEW